MTPPEARSYEQHWLRAERKFASAARSSQPLWRSVCQQAERLDAERITQEKISGLLDAELKRKVLLDAELVAPPEAKRALASLRTSSDRSPERRTPRTARMLT
eukprot:g23890.t1